MSGPSRHAHGFGTPVDQNAALWCFTRAGNDGHARARTRAKAIVAASEAAAKRDAAVNKVWNTLFRSASKRESAALYEELHTGTSPLAADIAAELEETDSVGYQPPAPPASPLAVPPTPPAVFQGRRAPVGEPATKNPFLDDEDDVPTAI